MSHCKPEELTLLALGEAEGLEDDRAHVAECAACAKEVAAFAALVDLARTVTPDDAVQQPPASVWESVQHEVNAGMPVDELAERRQRRSTAPWIAVAAVSGLLLGGIGVSALNRSDTQSDISLVAQTALEPLPGNDVTGIAQVEARDSGSVLTVDVADLPAREGYYEVWLLKPDVSNMVSIGVLPESGTGEFPLPETLDLTEFSVVDISREAYDGNAEHSTDSVVRGVL